MPAATQSPPQQPGPDHPAVTPTTATTTPTTSNKPHGQRRRRRRRRSGRNTRSATNSSRLSSSSSRSASRRSNPNARPDSKLPSLEANGVKRASSRYGQVRRPTAATRLSRSSNSSGQVLSVRANSAMSSRIGSGMGRRSNTSNHMIRNMDPAATAATDNAFNFESSQKTAPSEWMRKKLNLAKTTPADRAAQKKRAGSSASSRSPGLSSGPPTPSAAAAASVTIPATSVASHSTAGTAVAAAKHPSRPSSAELKDHIFYRASCYAAAGVPAPLAHRFKMFQKDDRPSSAGGMRRDGLNFSEFQSFCESMLGYKIEHNRARRMYDSMCNPSTGVLLWSDFYHKMGQSANKQEQKNNSLVEITRAKEQSRRSGVDSSVLPTPPSQLQDFSAVKLSLPHLANILRFRAAADPLDNADVRLRRLFQKSDNKRSGIIDATQLGTVLETELNVRFSSAQLKDLVERFGMFSSPFANDRVDNATGFHSSFHYEKFLDYIDWVSKARDHAYQQRRTEMADRIGTERCGTAMAERFHYARNGDSLPPRPRTASSVMTARSTASRCSSRSSASSSIASASYMPRYIPLKVRNQMEQARQEAESLILEDEHEADQQQLPGGPAAVPEQRASSSSPTAAPKQLSAEVMQICDEMEDQPYAKHLALSWSYNNRAGWTHKTSAYAQETNPVDDMPMRHRIHRFMDSEEASYATVLMRSNLANKAQCDDEPVKEKPASPGSKCAITALLLRQSPMSPNAVQPPAIADHSTRALWRE
jgi:hypothetical protein